MRGLPWLSSASELNMPTNAGPGSATSITNGGVARVSRIGMIATASTARPGSTMRVAALCAGASWKHSLRDA
jgi:hypothetical protein